jgi:hypothetical protein
MGDDNRMKFIYIKNGALRLEMQAVLRPGRFLGSHYLAFTIPNRTFIITMDRVRAGIRAARKNKQVAVREKKLAGEIAAEEALPEAVLPRSTKEEGINTVLSRLFSPLTLRMKRAHQLQANLVQPKSFFSRFVEGYTLLEREGEVKNKQLTIAISEWFSRQSSTGNIPELENQTEAAIMDGDEPDKS